MPPHPCYDSIVRNQPMQLTSKTGSNVVDFYEVKYLNGDVSNRIALRIITHKGVTKSRKYVKIKDVQREVWMRIKKYGYKQTKIHTEPQFFNAGLVMP